MIISIFGLGFVGLTTALGLADKGFTVRGYDVDVDRTAKLSAGEIPFHEPGLDEALVRNLGKTFTLSDNPANAASGSDICFLCVGTPGQDDGSADLKYIFSVIDSIAEVIPEDCVLVIKSTVPPGTVSERVLPYVRSKGLKNPVASNPEFLREGKCWEDFMYADRIVCGVTDDSAKTKLEAIYKPFDAPIHFVKPSTAEFIKYLSNSLLASLISYSNEMSLLADAVGGIEVAKAFKVLHEDRRLAGAGINTYIYPGCGYGGYCLPKDTTALSAASQNRGFTPHILNAGISLNNEMPKYAAKKIMDSASGKSEKIGILGLSFKPDSDDVRDSPAAKIIDALIKCGYKSIYAHDPIAAENFKVLYGQNVTYCDTAENVFDVCDTVAVVTAWPEYRQLRKRYPRKKICDLRYCLE